MDQPLDSRPKIEVSGGTDAEFLCRLKAGNQLAWTQFVQEQSQRLYSYLYYNLPSNQDREDVLMDTMVACVRSIPNFDGQKATLATFVYSIAQRKVADYWRKHKKTTELPEAVPVRGISSKGIELEEAMAQLPVKYRQALLLRYHIGLNVTELAGSMELTYKATESLLSRARSALRHQMSND